LAAAANYGKATEESWQVRKNGSTFWACVVINAIRDDEGVVEGFGVFIRDLTDAKLAESAARLEARNKELEQFNYVASHDLQEPLRMVSMYAQLLEEDFGKELDPTALQYIAAIKTANERMKNLVRSLMEYSKVGDGESRSFTDCNQLVRNVLDDLLGLVEKSHAKVYIDALPTLYCYGNELRQVFQNLISNAIKFQRKGVAPVIRIDCQKQNQTFVFSVSDNGIGIHPKYFEKIFQVFKRLNRESEFEGQGIGLAKCKKIIELHGGKIWVESSLGAGSSFKFSIDNYQV
jgi:light-regulated signal transduction histidine kinase (bacteriophytochrome)